MFIKVNYSIPTIYITTYSQVLYMPIKFIISINFKIKSGHTLTYIYFQSLNPVQVLFQNLKMTCIISSRVSRKM